MSVSTKIAFAAFAFTFALATVDTIEAGCRSGRSATGSPARRPNYNFSSAPRRSTHNVSSYHRAAPTYRAPIHHAPTVRSTPVFTNTVAPAPIRQTVSPRPIVSQPTQFVTPQMPVSQPVASPQPTVMPQPLNAAQPATIVPEATSPTPTNAADAALQALLG